jgi:hypothetical protein
MYSYILFYRAAIRNRNNLYKNRSNKYLVKILPLKMILIKNFSKIIIKSLKINKAFFKTIQFNQIFSRFFKDKNNFKMSLQNLIKLIIKINKLFLEILGNNKIKHLKLVFFQDFNLKIVNNNHYLFLVSLVKIQQVYLEAIKEDHYSIMNKLYLETHL